MSFVTVVTSWPVQTLFYPDRQWQWWGIENNGKPHHKWLSLNSTSMSSSNGRQFVVSGVSVWIFVLEIGVMAMGIDWDIGSWSTGQLWSLFTCKCLTERAYNKQCRALERYGQCSRHKIFYIYSQDNQTYISQANKPSTETLIILCPLEMQIISFVLQTWSIRSTLSCTSMNESTITWSSVSKCAHMQASSEYCSLKLGWQWFWSGDVIGIELYPMYHVD